MDYPPPLIPLSPVMSSITRARTVRGQKARVPSILTSPQILCVNSGRAAIALALEHAGIQQQDEVLVPAYHCESMVSPIHWCKSTPVFYRINRDVSIDLDDISQKINAKTKALIVTHYFGFLQDMEPLVKLCDAYGIALIEDCAHALFGSRNGIPTGAWGNYAIASSMKFFPVYDGGILASSRLDITRISLEHPSRLFELKSLLNVIQKSIAYKRLGITGLGLKYIIASMESVWGFVKRATGRQDSGIHGPASSGGGYGLDEAWIHRRESSISTMIINRQSLETIVRQRRQNYVLLESELSKLPGTHALFDNLPEGVVPLVFPLYVDEPTRHFHLLKQNGVPVWRFGEFLDRAVTQEVCRNSVEMSAHIFQFPCHQELRKTEIDWMVAEIRKVLERPAYGYNP